MEASVRASAVSLTVIFLLCVYAGRVRQPAAPFSFPAVDQDQTLH